MYTTLLYFTVLYSILLYPNLLYSTLLYVLCSTLCTVLNSTLLYVIYSPLLYCMYYTLWTLLFSTVLYSTLVYPSLPYCVLYTQNTTPLYGKIGRLGCSNSSSLLAIIDNTPSSCFGPWKDWQDCRFDVNQNKRVSFIRLLLFCWLHYTGTKSLAKSLESAWSVIQYAVVHP